jgi:predicted permease
VSRGRLIGQTLADSVLLAALGGVAAVLVTRWGGAIVRSVLLPGVEFPDNGLGARVLPFILGLSMLAGLIAAIVPAVEATRRSLADTLRLTSGGITRSTHRVRAGLTIAQSALCVLLLVGSGLFVRSLRSVQALNAGFDPDGLLVATLVIEGGSLSEEEKRAFFPAAVERLASQPRVRAAAWSQSVPFYTSWIADLRIPGRDSLPSPRSGGPYINAASPDYFRTLGLRILRGRGFEPADFSNDNAVIVNDALARLYWPNEDALGACMHIGDAEDNPPCSIVIGVAENASRGSLNEEPNPQLYVPPANPAAGSYGDALFIRVDDDDPATISGIRRTLLALSPRLRYIEIQPISSFNMYELRAWRMGATMFTVFGILALIVAAIGLHSVLAFDVAQRTREIGLRSALGAGTARIISIVVGRAVRMTGIGLAIGVGLALAMAPRIAELLFEVQPRDPATFLITTGVLLVVSIIASSLPALRAARVDPNTALRAE